MVHVPGMGKEGLPGSRLLPLFCVDHPPPQNPALSFLLQAQAKDICLTLAQAFDAVYNLMKLEQNLHKPNQR